MNIKEYVRKIKNKELNSLDTIKSVIEKVKELNKDFHCFNNICEKEALKQAKIVDKNRKGKLAGVPKNSTLYS
jgi:Asp-tRNA(Asn)/Glu-tRNA(Gln) amidotransferase A subunit family amidase